MNIIYIEVEVESMRYCAVAMLAHVIIICIDVEVESMRWCVVATLAHANIDFVCRQK